MGSESEICDSKSGYCFCKHGVTGRYCDHCEKMYFGFESGSGCESKYFVSGIKLFPSVYYL